MCMWEAPLSSFDDRTDTDDCDLINVMLFDDTHSCFFPFLSFLPLLHLTCYTLQFLFWNHPQIGFNLLEIHTLDSCIYYDQFCLQRRLKIAFNVALRGFNLTTSMWPGQYKYYLDRHNIILPRKINRANLHLYRLSFYFLLSPFVSAIRSISYDCYYELSEMEQARHCCPRGFSQVHTIRDSCTLPLSSAVASAS